MPKTKSKRLTYSKDNSGKEILLKDDTLQVMMEWEKPYMEALIDALQPFGDVLEIGFGLGYSSSQIQKFKPKSHTIIENDPEVIEHAKKWAKQFPGVKVVEGMWQDLISQLGQFDSVFFDDYSPFTKEDINQIKAESKKYQNLAKETESLRDSIEETLNQFKNVKFTDSDLQKFGNYLTSKPNVTLQQVVDFLDNLVKQGNITGQQRANFLKTIQKSKTLKEEGSEASIETLEWLNQKGLGDRFITFVEIVLNSHLKPKGRISGYMGSPETKTKNPEFQKKILSRKDVKFSEKTIPVKVPANCTYYQGDKALIIVLEKI